MNEYIQFSPLAKIRLTFKVTIHIINYYLYIYETENKKLTSFRVTLGNGNGVVKSISASISDISSEKPFGNVVSPGLPLLLPADCILGSFFNRRFCINNRPITNIRHNRTPAVTDMIK